jgi:hypothetical protein
MMRKLAYFIANVRLKCGRVFLLNGAVMSSNASVAGVSSALTSWNDSASKNAVIAFVEPVTTQGSPDFVPEAERVATFDNDGTLDRVGQRPAIESLKRLAVLHNSPTLSGEGTDHLAS